MKKQLANKTSKVLEKFSKFFVDKTLMSFAWLHSPEVPEELLKDNK